MPLLSDSVVIEAVKQGLKRAAAVAHGHMKRGLNSLATVTAVAPLVGLFGTILGIANSFSGCGVSKAHCMAAMAERLSVSLVPTALGLLVAIPALWCYKYLSSEVEAFDLEIENASVALVNYLIIHLGRRRQLQP